MKSNISGERYFVDSDILREYARFARCEGLNTIDKLYNICFVARFKTVIYVLGISN